MSQFQNSFRMTSAPVIVEFGAGTIATLGERLEELRCDRALVLSTPEQCDEAMRAVEILGPRASGVYTKAAMHTPVAVTQDAISHLEHSRADSLVAIGGGSTTGLGKAIAYRTGLPLVAVPTTYAGSEVTPILGQTEGGRKTTLTDSRVQPRVVIYDPELTLGLPTGITVTSALNAVAHAAEGLYARNRHPLAVLSAIEGMRAFRSALPRLVKAPDDIDARGEALYGAWLCGTVLGQVGMALHHKLCHVLGGSFGLPHAETHAVVLPHAIAYNARAVPDLLAPVAEIFGEPAGAGLHAFARSVGAPTALRDLGLKEGDLPKAAAIAVENAYWNPQPVTEAGILTLLKAAWAGEPPAN
jgi:maleylacetate reductase